MDDIPNRHTLLQTLEAEVPALSHAEVLLPGIGFTGNLVPVERPMFVNP